MVPIPYLFKIVFTYDIVWELDLVTTWSQRWDVYLKGNPEVGLLVLCRYLYIEESFCFMGRKISMYSIAYLSKVG